MPNSQLLLRAAQAAFWAALVFVFVMAVVPPWEAIVLFRWDKVEHFVTFYVLAGLAAAAFPRRRLIIIAVTLSAFGAMIEFVQALPIVQRDCDFWDWVADTVAIGAALAPLTLIWWRAQFRPA